MTTYEVVLDNAKIQVHCNDAKPPPPPIVVDLPARRVNQGDGLEHDEVSTPDTSSELVVGMRLGVGYFAQADQGPIVSGHWIYMPDTPIGYALTRATYVVIAYRENDNGTYTGPPFSNYNPGTNLASPYLNAESSGTIDNYAISPVPVGAYAGELEWSGNEILSRLTSAPGSQLPCTRLWNEDSMPPYDGSTLTHVAYYAVRLYYDPA